MKKLTWETVFNSEVAPDKRWGHIDNANAIAKQAGYKYFSWNGWVYEVDGNKTDVLVEDLQFNSVIEF